MGNMEPDAGTQVVASDPSTRSMADAANVATAPPGPVALMVRLLGTITVGGNVSRTVSVPATKMMA